MCDNYASMGGAIGLYSATLIVDCKANLVFSHNSAATGSGGALALINSSAHQIILNFTTTEHQLEEQYILLMAP